MPWQKRGFGDISIVSSVQPSKISRLQHPLISISGDDYKDTTAKMQVAPTLPLYPTNRLIALMVVNLQPPATQQLRENVSDASSKEHPRSISPHQHADANRAANRVEAEGLARSLEMLQDANEYAMK